MGVLRQSEARRHSESVCASEAAFVKHVAGAKLLCFLSHSELFSPHNFLSRGQMSDVSTFFASNKCTTLSWYGCSVRSTAAQLLRWSINDNAKAMFPNHCLLSGSLSQSSMPTSATQGTVIVLKWSVSVRKWAELAGQHMFASYIGPLQSLRFCMLKTGHKLGVKWKFHRSKACFS